MRRFYVRIHWSRENEWSGWREANSPEQALAICREAVALHARVSEEFLNQHAHFSVRPG